jgi:hypothetical protein
VLAIGFVPNRQPAPAQLGRLKLLADEHPAT